MCLHVRIKNTTDTQDPIYMISPSNTDAGYPEKVRAMKVPKAL